MAVPELPYKSSGDESGQGAQFGVLMKVTGGLKNPPSHTWCHHRALQSQTSALPRGPLPNADSVCLASSCGYDWYCTRAASLIISLPLKQTNTKKHTSTFYSIFLSPSPHTSCPWRSDLLPTSASGLPTQSHREGTDSQGTHRGMCTGRGHVCPDNG